MIDGFLLEFQMGEIFDAIKLSLAVATLAVGLGLWYHATYIRKGTE